MPSRDRSRLAISIVPLIALSLLCMGVGSAGAQVWTEGFEDGPAGAKPYYKDAPQSQIEISTENSAEGAQHVRVTLPGERRLEGINVTATGLTGARLAHVSAKVRGTGKIWLCLISANGWLYSPQKLPLTGEWQSVSLAKALAAADRHLGIHFISETVQKGAVFEVDDIQVRLDDAPVTYEVEVEPIRFEAEDYAQPKYVEQAKGALGGRGAAHSSYVIIDQIPFPRTSKPVSVYLRVQPASARDTYRLFTRQAGARQTLLQAKPTQTGRHWVRFPALLAGEAGDTFGIDFRQAKGCAEKVTYDAVVLSTDDALTPEALDAAPPLVPQAPLARVARCARPPVIDGDPGDACWANTVACTDFLLPRTSALVAAQTDARLCYDDDNLYVLFECDEPILDTAQQRRHEFKASVKKRDGDTYRDDACLVLLQPDTGDETVYDFTVNALGTVTDAQCMSSDLWASRDTEWNSSARSAGEIGEASWSAEMAIPLADLGVERPLSGQRWQAVIGRIAKARNETSSWNPSDRGFHDPAAWGGLVFADGVETGVRLSAPGSVQVGPNAISVRLSPTPEATGVYIVSTVDDGATVQRTTRFVPVAGKADLSCEFPVTAEGAPKIAHAVLDAATLKPLSVTAALARPVRSSVATLHLSCDGPYELYVNAERLAAGLQADNEAIPVPLQKGSNVFALKLTKGTASVRIEPPDNVVDLPAAWKMTPADTPDATQPELDDRGWPVAPVSDGGIVGEPGSAVILRHTLLWEKTRAWPTPDPALHIARNTNQHITLICDGLPKRKLADWTTYLAVPPEFDILGSTGYYGVADYQPLFQCTQLGEQQIDGRPMKVAKITATKTIATGRHYIFSLFNAFVRYREESGEPKTPDTSFVYWSAANGGTISEPLQTIPVRILPPIQGRRPKTLTWQLWGSFFGAMDDKDMALATLETARAAGITDIVSGDAWTSDHVAEFGMTTTRGMNFQAWSLNMKPYLQEHPEDRQTTFEGKPSDSLLCTTRMLGDSWQPVAQAVAENIDVNHPDTLDYDYEFSPFTGPHSCYCPECLAAFRERAKLAPDLELTPTIIKEQYAAQWVDFMAWRVAQMFRKFKDTIHELSPDTHFSTYSGYQSADNPVRYGVDWKYIGELQAADHVGCGYGRPVPAIFDTVEALGGIPALFGELIHPYRTSDTTTLIPYTKARLLRRALDSTGGVLIYDRLPMDGRCWAAIADSTRLVAEVEDVFLSGKRSTLPDQPEASVQVVSHEGTTLVCVLNSTRKPAPYSVKLPAEAGSGREFYSGATVGAGETVTPTVEPGDAVVYILTR